jgi:hypothetical protein
LDGDAAANHFARKNMHFYILRNTLIEQAAVAQDWATVQRLATDGLKWSDANKLQPLSQYYRSHLIKATESQGKPATNQLLTQFLATERLADYERWKASIPAEEWPLVRASLLSVNALRAETTYAILVHEEAWEEMMNWALGSPSDMRTINDVLDAHGATLIERFPDDVARWCVMGIEKVLDKYTNNRNDYRTIADLLERMVEMGLGKQAAQEAALLREIYSNRPALLQELQNV